MPKKTTKKSQKPIKKTEDSGLSIKEFSIERIYNASITKVWNALTKNNEIKEWYFDLPDFKAQKGFEFTFNAGKDENNLYKHLCKITEVIPRQKLAYSWQYEGYDGYSEVIFELFEETGQKTRLKLTHTGINTFPQTEDLKMENFAEGWTSIIGKSLKEYVEYRKVILFNMITVDGFFEGEKGFGDLSWHNVDQEFNEFAIDQMKEIDTLIFGRKTYELMASYWPTTGAKEDDPIVAQLMNDVSKLVFSKTLSKVNWSNSTLVLEDIESAIVKVKEKAHKDIFIFGSGLLTNEFMKLGLIDEIRLIINPTLLGRGTLLFKGIEQKLKLLKTKSFRNGNVLLYYEVLKEKN